MRTLLLNADRDEDVLEAARLLRKGLVIAFPTETVYGLGARADDGAAMQYLMRVKERPADKKMTILMPDRESAEAYAAQFNPAARALAAAFWPGPLTLVVDDGRQGAVGLRVPDLPATRRLLRAAGVPVAAPSANRSGRPPATTAGEVMRVFEGLIPCVLDGGPARMKVASTVVEIAGDQVRILRAGALSEERIRAVLARRDAP
jgi:L-threonylcarbamoyladenylate synthase